MTQVTNDVTAAWNSYQQNQHDGQLGADEVGPSASLDGVVDEGPHMDVESPEEGMMYAEEYGHVVQPEDENVSGGATTSTPATSAEEDCHEDEVDAANWESLLRDDEDVVHDDDESETQSDVSEGDDHESHDSDDNSTSNARDVDWYRRHLLDPLCTGVS